MLLGVGAQHTGNAVQQDLGSLLRVVLVVAQTIKDIGVNAVGGVLQLAGLVVRIERHVNEGQNLGVGLENQRLHSVCSLSRSQTGSGGGDAALGAHDGSALAVPQEVDQSSSLNGMLAGGGDGHAHGDLGEATVGLVAELDLLTDGEAGVVSQSRLVLGGGRIPLEDAGVLAMQLYEALKTVPVLQCTVLHRYALMMHYCLTGNHLAISDINSEFLAQVRNTVQQPAHDRHKVWMAEQGLLQMVRTGDLNYRQALSASMGISAGVPVRSDDALRQSKTNIIVFTSLVCRAAIEGGLSPEEAYALGDSYIQSAENAKTLDDLEPLGLMMYDDFVRRVHKCRTNPHLSQQVQKCMDYIEMNLDKKIRAADIAALVGYTEYYMTHKFKEETGLSVTDYIKFAKIERAKVLLKSTNQTVQDIAAALSFSTRNYFSRIFQEVTGQTPMEYREK